MHFFSLLLQLGHRRDQSILFCILEESFIYDRTVVDEFSGDAEYGPFYIPNIYVILLKSLFRRSLRCILSSGC